jgi:hypothetical protein
VDHHRHHAANQQSLPRRLRHHLTPTIIRGHARIHREDAKLAQRAR